MDLNNIPEVVIDLRGGYKYIVAEVSDEKGNKKPLVRANESCGYHADILKKVKMETGLFARCLGGGRIQIDPENKTIRIWNQSVDFGREPDRQLTVKMLQEAFPGWTITASR